jgi:penicillin-binding protein 2
MLNIPLKDYFRETRIYGSRLTFAAGVMVLIVVILLTRLLWLQVVHHKRYVTQALANQITPVPIPPVRGLILDRNGVVLAQNYPVYTLDIIPEQVSNMAATLKKLGKLVTLTPADLKQFQHERKNHSRFENITLRAHLTDEEAARIAINRPFLQGVDLHARLQRYYPLGSFAVHLLGYVGRITEDDLRHINTAAYRGTSFIGKLGIEQFYEKLLLGKVGVKQEETNAHGRSLGVLARTEPVAGKNLILNVDAHLQAIGENALRGERGAAIVMNPNTGSVLAFISMPNYDPNPFVDGINQKAYDALLNNPDKPLINRALNGQYSPGSTIKPFLGLGALESGEVKASDTVTCHGWFQLPGDRHRYRDWKRGGHGVMDLHDAIEQSCDVYFYTIAVKLGIDYIHDWLTKLGFGSRTGIDLDNESAGLVPSRAWRRAQGERWYIGETVVTGIGQGPLLVTPLQLVDAVSALANGKALMRPELLRAIENPVTHALSYVQPHVNKPLVLDDPRHLQAIVRAMIDVVNGPHGTARGIGWNAPYPIAGKTGTAQLMTVAQNAVYHRKDVPERLRDNALFISFAPADHPQVAVAVIVENGGHGGGEAAHIARKLMDYVILGKKDKTKASQLPVANTPKEEVTPQ